MSKPNFNAIEIEKVLSANAPQASDDKFMTNEGIEIKDIYTKEDIKDAKHLNDVAGIAPNTRDHTLPCMWLVLGLFVNMLVSQQPKNPMPFTSEIWQWDKRVYL